MPPPKSLDRNAFRAEPVSGMIAAAGILSLVVLVEVLVLLSINREYQFQINVTIKR